MSEPDAKRAMLTVAENYEKIAKRVRARKAGVMLPQAKGQ